MDCQGLVQELVWAFSLLTAVSVFTKIFDAHSVTKCVCVSDSLCFSKTHARALILGLRQTSDTLTPKLNWELLWKSDTCNYFNERKI